MVRRQIVFNRQGNKHFWNLVVVKYSASYTKATKAGKSAITAAIVNKVGSQSPAGGFVKQHASTGLWYEVGGRLLVIKGRSSHAQCSPHAIPIKHEGQEKETMAWTEVTLIPTVSLRSYGRVDYM